MDKKDASNVINIFAYWDVDIKWLEDHGFKDFAADLRAVFKKHTDVYEKAVNFNKKERKTY